MGKVVSYKWPSVKQVIARTLAVGVIVAVTAILTNVYLWAVREILAQFV